MTEEKDEGAGFWTGAGKLLFQGALWFGLMTIGYREGERAGFKAGADAMKHAIIEVIDRIPGPQADDQDAASAGFLLMMGVG